ncbi:MAG: HAD-IC family P-type ATPase [Christensenellaceae bacterium]|jgi:cation-transporting ATPase E
MNEPERFFPTSEDGLNEAAIHERIEAGLVNQYKSNTTKSYGQILKEHFFTFYNILNIALAALLMAVGAYKDMLFAVIVVANFVIGVVQEFSSKRTLDKLALIVAAKANVVRSGKKKSISIGELVLDDVMELKTGNQIPADAIMLSGYLEVNESLITGESDVIKKNAGDFLYSGSFVVSGTGRARVENVGEDNYANQISQSAKAAKKRKSELYSTLGWILKTISFILVPMGVMLFYKQHILLGLIPSEAIVKTVAAIIGMIPEGLILMTSIAFVASVIFLAYDHTLVQDMYGIETLARSDVICFDKTGTLTAGEISFDSEVPLTKINIEPALCNLCGALQDENATMTALRSEYPPCHDYTVLSTIPFSSARKFSGACFEGHGSYIMGATEFVFPSGHDHLRRQAEALSKGGKRVLVFAHSNQVISGDVLPDGLTPLAFLLLSDTLRSDVKETLAYFIQYDVDIKIISGDNPGTVAYIAKSAGVPNADRFIDASTLHTENALRDAVRECSVFGRVSPAQKKDMVRLMKEDGRKVAMMGDGVNDVLALKEADCSVAVASGSDAAKNISDIVLMDSSLKHLLHVVEDGRKIINNIQRVATLFITKTVYSVLLALCTLFLFDNAYPFTPMQLAVISFINIGAPSFFLALEPQYDRIHGKFISNVLAKSLPGGLAIMLCILLMNILTSTLGYTPNEYTTMCVFVAVAGGLWVLFKVSSPWTFIRRIVFAAMIGLFAVGVIFFHNFLELYPLDLPQIIVLVVVCVIMPYLMHFFEWLTRRVIAFLDKRKIRKSKLIKRLDIPE